MAAPVPQYRVFESFWKFGRCPAKDPATPARSTLVGFEQESGAGGIENGLRRGGHAVGLKIFAHDEEDVEIFGGGFCGDETAPNEDTA